jgi:hypothetical protein
MPLFKARHDEPASPPPPAEEPARKGSIFSRRNRSQSPTSYHTSNSRVSGVSRRSSSSDNSSRTGSRRGGFLGLSRNDHHGDPSILAARQKVNDAEAAEREADHALALARVSVREAREQVKILEREAKEECVQILITCQRPHISICFFRALRAKAKQAEAKVINKTARGLGRHG